LIADVLTLYALEVVPQKRSARNIAYNIGNLRRWWGVRRVSDITANNCRAYAATKSVHAARSDLEKLASALQYWQAEKGGIAILPRVIKPARPGSREQWLTRSEAARLLSAARRVPHLARFILLGIYTGSRSGAIREAEWSWVNFHSGVMRRRAHGEADSAIKRRPPVKLGSRILAHLRRWRRIDGPSGRYIVHYNGQRIADAFRTSWHKAVARAGLPDNVTPHTLRHTRATWLMLAGVDLWQAAKHLGMTTRVLEATYGHHRPDFQRDASEV
jgi:integrase